MTINILMSIVATPLIAATGAVIAFLIIDAITEIKRFQKKREEERHRMAA